MRTRGRVAASLVVLAGAVAVAAVSLSTASGPRLSDSIITTADSTDVGTFGLVPSLPRSVTSYRSPAPAAPMPTPAALPALVAAPITIGALGIPDLVLDAYKNAEATLATTLPGCHLPWHLVAGIGRIESGHAGGGRTDAAGTTLTPVLGPVLDGSLAGNNVITDTDGGALDGDATHDRAVGPMQFIPATWKKYASDGNGDGVSNPSNIFDASLATGKYLCSGGLDLADIGQQSAAVRRYNNSAEYVANVLSWSAAYAAGGTPVPGLVSVPGPVPVPGNGAPNDSALSADALAVAVAAAEDTGEPTAEAAAPALGIPGLPSVPLPVLPPPTLPTPPVLPCLAFCPPAP